MATPSLVVSEAFAYAHDTESESAKETAAQELKLKALKAAKANKQRRR